MCQSGLARWSVHLKGKCHMARQSTLPANLLDAQQSRRSVHPFTHSGNTRLSRIHEDLQVPFTALGSITGENKVPGDCNKSHYPVRPMGAQYCLHPTMSQQQQPIAFWCRCHMSCNRSACVCKPRGVLESISSTTFQDGAEQAKPHGSCVACWCERQRSHADRQMLWMPHALCS